MAEGEIAAAVEGLAKDAAEAGRKIADSVGKFAEDSAANAERTVDDAVQTEDRITKSLNDIRPDAPPTETAGQSTITSKLGPADEGESPATPPRARFGTSTSTDYKRTFFTANPETEGQVVVHHAVEQQVMTRYPGVVSPSEMHSLENLRGIPKGATNNRVHLSQIRKEWNRFYKANPNPTQEQLLDFATKVDDKFGHLFNPPIR
ncbi:MAG TPA: hypothetical protein VJX10_15275 [Pseudonocardiaceae bacterium]|nr:hypothetical protein [Pseudonocardiaceae bacterium]